MINTTTIEIYSVEHWENNWDELLERVETGEHIGIKNEETGHIAVMVPAHDELIKIHTILNNDAS
jgi:antitoxin (DNA-binding transcriptional repressor) of toxin-antitoxin stability system